jgi:hypothetical protein
MSISKRPFVFISLAAVMIVALSAPVSAADCTPRVDASLADQNNDMGQNLTTYKFRVEVGHQGSFCAAVEYDLNLKVENSAGEEGVVVLRKHAKVNSESVSMLVTHQLSKDDRLASWDVTNISCHACAPGD